MASATITSKGQLTIPKTVRDALRLNTGDKVEFVITENGEAIIRPITKKVDDIFARLHKKGQRPVSVDEMDHGIREKMRKRFR